MSTKSTVARLAAAYNEGRSVGLSGVNPHDPIDMPVSDLYDLLFVLREAGKADGYREFKRRAIRAADVVGCIRNPALIETDANPARRIKDNPQA